jgi:hypothetical protein
VQDQLSLRRYLWRGPLVSEVARKSLRIAEQTQIQQWSQNEAILFAVKYGIWHSF